ncbi:MAG: ribonuclease H-like YkuK family protein [bacterium]|nr:ribonuclease H-like YkuK family protein [bacterium]
MAETIFHSWTSGVLTLSEMINEIGQYIKSKPERAYQIIVGSDSSTTNPVSVVTAVTVWRVGNGGIHFWFDAEKKTFHTLQDRIYEETIRSITLAQELRDRMREKLGEDALWDKKITVHIDVGENGPTKDLIDQVVGMVKGFGFQAVIKPNSFGASVVADKHT